jgi:hypothetical protein
MKNKYNFFLIATLIITLLSSCNNENQINLTKDSEGFYTSKLGNFKIKFPASPVPNVIDNQIGLDKFKIHHYRAVKSKNEIFTLEFIDLPDNILSSISDEANYYESAINNLSNLYRSKGFELDSKKDILHKGLKGIEFRFNGSMGSIIGRLFKVDKTTYTISFMGQPTTSEIENYMNSFELLNKE